MPTPEEITAMSAAIEITGEVYFSGLDNGRMFFGLRTPGGVPTAIAVPDDAAGAFAESVVLALAEADAVAATGNKDDAMFVIDAQGGWVTVGEDQSTLLLRLRSHKLQYAAELDLSFARFLRDHLDQGIRALEQAGRPAGRA